MTEEPQQQSLSEDRYQVVVNDEEQYSVWPLDREIPAGWRATGTAGLKDECLAYIETMWTDITPLSVRLAMQASSGR